MQPLFQLLGSTGPLSNDCKAWLSENTKRQEVKKRQLLLRPGEVSNRIFFIEKGLFRGFDSSMGSDQTIWFMAENDLMMAVSSFYAQTPGEEGIEAIEDSMVISLSHQQTDQLYDRFPGFNLNGRKFTEAYYARTFTTMLSLRIKSSVERYRRFETYYPHLIDRIPGVYLCSFLGMSRDALYRARIKSRKIR